MIGNKSDLVDKRKVSSSSGEALAKKYKAAFLETSALDGRVRNFNKKLFFFFLNFIQFYFQKNVDNSFIALLKLIDHAVNNNVQTMNKYDKTSHPVKAFQSNNQSDYHAHHKNGLTTTPSPNGNKNICTIS